MIKQYVFKGDSEYKRWAIQWDGQEETAIKIASKLEPYGGAVYLHVPPHRLAIHTDFGMIEFDTGEWCVFTKFGSVIRMTDKQFREYYEEVDDVKKI